jgi:RNA methyltransferase, TrmH family
MSQQLISSVQHSLVKHLVKLRKEPSYRQEKRAVVLEGIKPIKEVLHFVQKLFYTAEYTSIASSLMVNEKWEISQPVLEKISVMKHPEGIVAEVLMPEYGQLNQQRKILALDGLNDPGNLGTILRTALAFGWDAIFFLPNCCDPFNEKVLRAARGAQFKLDLIKGTEEQLLAWAEKEKVTALLADIQGKRPEEIPPANRRLLIMGNEAHGASKALKERSLSVSIPMPGEMESLNVAIASGILLYLLECMNERF